MTVTTGFEGCQLAIYGVTMSSCFVNFETKILGLARKFKNKSFIY